jgi:diguanylate cyclase (GGDEF)-like protein
VLQLAAEVLQRGCRETDLAARLGGDEFAVILPGCDRDAALARCEELRASLQGEEWNAVHPDLAVTASVGVAAWSEPLDGAALLREADARLYRAKHAGRNRVA